MSVITSGNHAFVLTESVTSVAINAFAQHPMMMPLAFNQRPSSGPQEEQASVSGLGKMQLKASTGNSARDATIQQFKRRWVHDEYSLIIDFERKYVDDEQYGHFDMMGSKLGAAGNRTVEDQAANVFNDAFLGATILAEDGLSLCNGAHVNVDGGNSQDNSGTNALTYAGYKATRIAMRKMTDYRGENILITPDTIWAPIDLEEDATQVAQAVQKPNSANNDINAFRGVAVNVNPYFTDTNAWFLTDSQMQMTSNPWYWRKSLEFFGSRDFDTMIMSVGSYARWSMGPSDWRWVYGNNPS